MGGGGVAGEWAREEECSAFDVLGCLCTRARAPFRLGRAQEGLRLELEALPAIFGTADALTGLRSVLKRERPSWKNA